jgi:hypothetical protein
MREAGREGSGKGGREGGSERARGSKVLALKQGAAHTSGACCPRGSTFVGRRSRLAARPP